MQVCFPCRCMDVRVNPSLYVCTHKNPVKIFFRSLSCLDTENTQHAFRVTSRSTLTRTRWRFSRIWKRSKTETFSTRTEVRLFLDVDVKSSSQTPDSLNGRNMIFYLQTLQKIKSVTFCGHLRSPKCKVPRRGFELIDVFRCEFKKQKQSCGLFVLGY